MADLTDILGGPWAPSSETTLSPEDQLRDAILASGMISPKEILLDGKIHRFISGTKGSTGHGDKTGWYIAFGDGIPAGRFGCWRSGIESTWRADVGRKLTHTEEMAHVRRMAEAKALRDAEAAKKQEIAVSTVESIWSECGPASPDHPYLKAKGIKTHGARVTGDGRLIVPLFDQAGNLSSLQYIAADGGKLYHSGAQTGSRFWQVGTLDEPGTLYVAEGFATAATIHETTNRPCIVAYSASNLVPVTGILREIHGSAQDIVIVADNDASGVGQRYAEQASAKHGARMVVPPEPGDANDYKQAGHDLAALLSPPKDDWLIPADDFCSQPAPISWLVKRWIQDKALIMVHGPSGGGKTFVVLDWCLRMASGTTEWATNRVRPGTVVYLAGEGHHGLRGRVAAWKVHNSAGPLSMWLSRDGCDLNTPAGYLRVVDNIRALPKRPSLIVVDTLHRFLLGDENSAQDAKTMLDACGALMAEFGCSVLLVHHTGVSDEAQHRARGSSAWRGALDIEISIVPGKDEAPMQIVQRKSKDAELAEPVWAELTSVTIPGWLDEDEQPVTSAVVSLTEAPVVAKKESKVDGLRKQFEAAWWASGAEDREGMPYISRSALLNYLTGSLNIKLSTAEKKLKPGYPNELIGALLIAEIIMPFENGWAISNDVHGSSMIIERNKR
jgi:putative DNA primase/helicase